MNTRLVVAGLALLVLGVAVDGTAVAIPFREPLVLGLVVCGATFVASPLVGEV